MLANDFVKIKSFPPIGIILLRDFPKHLTQWVGMGIITVGMIITLFRPIE